MDAFAENPRAVIGSNNPPEPTAIERADVFFKEEFDPFLNDHPVIANEDEARDAHRMLNRGTAMLRSVDAERTAKTEPLYAEWKRLNAEYHPVHNTDRNRPGRLNARMNVLLTSQKKFMQAEEARRQAAAEAAWRAKEEADRAAREAAQREEEAAQAAEAGVCDVDLGQAIEDARATSAEAGRVNRQLARAERDTTVRIGGGLRKVMTLRNEETLHVTDWQAAISEMGLTRDIMDAIIKSARAYRKLTDALPTGVEATFERGL
jgi:hypothetical protein